MANISITNAKYNDDDLLVSCNMDGTPVVLIDKSWDLEDIVEMGIKGTAGGAILGVFFPAGFAAGAIIGALSKIATMETGYYTKRKYCMRAGKLYRDDLF